MNLQLLLELLLLGCLGLLLLKANNILKLLVKGTAKIETLSVFNLGSKERMPGDVRPLSNLDYTTVKPIAHRPFLTMPHVSLGIKLSRYDEWIQIDRGYHDRIMERLVTMRDHPTEAIGTNEIVNPAIQELYEEIMCLLPRRFPTIFQADGNELRNLVTNSIYSLGGDCLDHVTMLRNLGENVEEDFYFMCPDDEGDLRLQGYIACFPGGLLSPSRLGQSLREIHQPVPGYEKRLGNGADRYLKKLEPGKFINRMNWSLQVDGPDLFRIDGNNYYPEQGHIIPENLEAINIASSYLRVESQTLTRLHKSRAVIFCVRSYLTSLEDIRDEGNGPLLADAIKSMPEKLGHYKRRPFWEQDVYAYLRGEAAESPSLAFKKDL